MLYEHFIRQPRYPTSSGGTGGFASRHYYRFALSERLFKHSILLVHQASLLEEHKASKPWLPCSMQRASELYEALWDAAGAVLLSRISLRQMSEKTLALYMWSTCPYLS